MSLLNDIGARAKKASYEVALMSTAKKNELLNAIAETLEQNSTIIIQQNQIDIKNARENGMKETLIDRLMLDEKRIKSMAKGVRDVALLNDPVGEIEKGTTMPNGLIIQKYVVPLGVIGIIYESRPNVTVDAGALCLKSGNATILRGGKEAIFSNKIITNLMRKAIKEQGANPDIMILIEDTTRESSNALMRLNQYLDVLIPRGGASLIKAVVENATVPVIETGTGNCHVFVDEFADFDKALKIVYNAKVSRPSVCNACESLLVHKKVAEEFLPLIKSELDKANVEIRGCEKTKAILPDVILATEQDYYTEFLDYIISVKVIDNVIDAISHINEYSTSHSESIVTESYTNANLFTKMVDSAAVYVNASTRFTDGSEFGLGAEIGISTQKLHARGPMGLKQLTTCKYIILGDGQIR